MCDWVGQRGGILSPADLAAYQVVPREPIDIGYRGLHVRTNPPPSAGGILIAAVLAELDREPAPPTRERLVAAMIDGEATVKTFKKTSSEVWLLPHNPAFEPIDGHDATILGKVVTVLRRV